MKRTIPSRTLPSRAGNIHWGILMALLALMMQGGCLPILAAVVNAHYFRMGEFDSGAVPGRQVEATRSLVDGQELIPIGTPLYTDAEDPAQTHTGSILALQLNGDPVYLQATNGLAMPEDRFGMEIWVRPDTQPQGFSIIAYAGDTTLDGYGFYQSGGEFGVSYGGVGRFGGIDARPGEWTHLAFVKDGPISTLYSNGIPVKLTNLVPRHPRLAGFAVGAHPQTPPGEYFRGALDELRLFRFEAGAFQDSDLLIHQRMQTFAAAKVTGTSATLRAELLPQSIPTWVWFEWGKDLEFNQQTTPLLVNPSTQPHGVNATLANLDPATRYQIRPVASNQLGVVYGTDTGFQTRFWVTSLANDGPGSLRELLRKAPSKTEIQFAVSGIIRLSGSGLMITNEVSLVNSNPLTVILDGGGKWRPLEITTGALVQIRGLTIQNGKARDGAISNSFTESPHGESGGGILNRGNLSLYDCIVEDNAAGDGGRVGLPGFPSNGGRGGDGGGILNQGELWLQHCLVRNNRAGRGGPGSEIESILGPGAGGPGGHGGGIATLESCVLLNSSIIENTAGEGGMGGGNQRFPTLNSGAGGKGGWGGGIVFLRNCDVIQCTVGGNSAGNPGQSGNSLGADLKDGGEGGAISEFPGANEPLVLQVSFSTLAHNSAASTNLCSGIFNSQPPESSNDPVLYSSVIAANRAPNATMDRDLKGAFLSFGYNVIGSLGFDANLTLAASADLDAYDQWGSPSFPYNVGVGTLTQQSPLAWVYPLLPDSPAIDAGPRLAYVTDLLGQFLGNQEEASQDQIGNARRLGIRPDVGSVEFDAAIYHPWVITGSLQFSELANANPKFTEGRFTGVLTPGGYPMGGYFEFGPSTAYGTKVPLPQIVHGFGAQQVEAKSALLPTASTLHFRLVATNALGSYYGQDLTQFIPAAKSLGDEDGDGTVSGAELAKVLRNYSKAPQWLLITEPGGMGQTNVTFALPGLDSSPFLVEGSGDMKRWETLGFAIPRYEFLDTNSPGAAQRFYRLKLQ